MRVYVASSWRNPYYDDVLAQLRHAGHVVWNWRRPPTGGEGFGWQQCGLASYKHGDKVGVDVWMGLLSNPIAQIGFASDLAGMNWCDAGVLLHPCGKSAHLEAGWLAGRGKKVHILVPEPIEPDLMPLALNGEICDSVQELLDML